MGLHNKNKRVSLRVQRACLTFQACMHYSLTTKLNSENQKHIFNSSFYLVSYCIHN
ncbi:hypothetical protein Lalb_Chr06g0165011 [Lupinus albus]|uniref:Uncharacterized protein n=1 Tax=Lupinus albus TaxID=3870 RepID=A0A6A4QCF3_LUPAL|nr:hypothetical protein Lalb_Chr06g0165011 [Lupinus albus]